MIRSVVRSKVKLSVHSWREEFSMVNRAGNSCSPVRGSFFGAAIPAVCRYGVLVVAAVEMVVSKNT